MNPKNTPMMAAACLCTFMILSARQINAVKYGDEKFGDIAGGMFWAFHSEGVSIINPNTCKIESTLKTDENGKALPNRYNDGIYMQKDVNDMSEQGKGYIMIGSAIPTFDLPPYTEGGSGEALTFSVEDQELISRIPVGLRPVHSYGVRNRGEFWMHSDDDGHFYIIDLDDVTKHSGKKVKAHVFDENHGKLLWDEADHLAQHGYATSTGEQVIFILDMKERKLISTFNYTNYVLPNTCGGTHAIAYSNVNKHLYVECSGGGGSLEISVMDPINPTFVKQWTDASGAFYEVPDGSYIVATNKGGNKLHVFKPQENSDESSLEFDVDVKGHPSTVSFLPISGSDDEADYIACMPLTENTNKNHMDKNGNLVCDYYGCDGAATAEDVNNGICAYDQSGRELLKVNIVDIEKARAGEAPFNGACGRCNEASNYADDECVCTPTCGSCDPDMKYESSNSGVACVDLGQVVNNGLKTATLVPNAGAVKQGRPYSYSPECAFGRTYRNHKRGGIYDASVANVPYNSIQIVNMETQKLHCAVRLDGNPSRVIYVPPTADGSSNKKDTSAGNNVKAGIIGFIGADILARIITAAFL